MHWFPHQLTVCTGGGGGVNFHYKSIPVYKRAAWRGILLRPTSIWMGMLFTSNVYQWDIIFTKKVYEYVNVKNNMNSYHFRYSKYMNRSYFSLTLVYEKGGILGPYPNSRQVNPPPPWQCAYKCKRCTGLMPLSFWDYTLPKCLILRGRLIFIEKTKDSKCSF